MKILDVGAGFKKFDERAVSIDSNPLCNPDILHDLNTFSWPFKDSEFDLIYTSHCLEHLENPKKAIEEIWRIGKPSSAVIIKLPHFSSRIAIDMEHTKTFSINTMRRYTKEFEKFKSDKIKFEIEKIKLNWQPRIDEELIPEEFKKFIPAIRFLNQVISWLANLNIQFCERIWCYYVGGMGEVEFRMKIEKNA